jgi:non-ribosomal peptide synthetase component F
MADVSSPGKTTQDAYAVAVNDRGQHALWQAELELPPGWRRQSAGMSRQGCLDAIAGAWPDIAPASVRADAAGQQYPARSVHPPGTPLAHELFAGQASRQPGSAAVAAGETRLTYRELDQSANRLAHYLREIGAGPETLIGVYLERGAEAVRSLLAIMKAGSGYLPLDLSLPPARLARICSETRPIAILAARPTPLARPDGPLNPPGSIPGPGCSPSAASPPNLPASRSRLPR